MAVRGGSWGIGPIRLPEFGITERIQNIVRPQAPRAASGGSNLFGPPAPSRAAPAVKGVSSGPVYGPTRPAGPARPSGGGGFSASAPAPAQQQYQQAISNAPFESQPEAPQIDFDALIAPALEAYAQAEAAEQGGYQANLSEIEGGATKQRTGIESAKRSSESQLKSTEQKTSSTAEGAINEARRAAAELQQGIASRYGAGVSTGLGAQSILGAQASRNISSIRANLQNALSEIETARVGVVETYNNALKETDAQTETLKQQARASLQQNLAQIGTAKGALQARKAELAYNAMEQYRQEINSVNQRNTAFKQQLFSSAQQAQQQLEAAQQRASQRITQLPTYKFGGNTLVPNLQADQATAGFNPEDIGAIRGTNYTAFKEQEEDEDLF